jgi:large subunit ribosomal protein L23
MKPELVIKGSVLSEKAAGLAEKGVFGLKVDIKASKTDIKDALKEVFDVDVVKIRTLVTRGDAGRRVRSKGASAAVWVKKANTKKAYVELKPGQLLPVPTIGMPADSE